MPSRPQHNWRRYLAFVAMFLLAHIASHFAFGKLSPGWTILSAGVFGIALGVPIGNAEYDPRTHGTRQWHRRARLAAAHKQCSDAAINVATFFIHNSRVPSCRYYTDGYEVMTLVCPAFTCCVSLLLGAGAVALLGER
jgi:hypothetical protein